MADLIKEISMKSEKKDCVWRYLPRDKRTLALATVDFLDTTGGRDKVFI